MLLYDAEAEAKKVVKALQALLDEVTLKKYGDLSKPDVMALVLDDKWRTAIGDRITLEVKSLTLALVSRIQQLGGRYGETTADLDSALAELGKRVVAHLNEMGVN